MMDCALQWNEGRDGEKVVYLRELVRQNQQNFMLEWIWEPRGSELLEMTSGFLTCTLGWMVVAFTEKEH